MPSQKQKFEKCVAATGYRNASFQKAEMLLKAYRKQAQQIQFFDADFIATKEHLYIAAQNALRAFAEKTNVSNSLAVETMLYASAQRQIQKAIEQCGIKPHTQRMAVLVIGDDPAQVEGLLCEVSSCLDVLPDETVLELNGEKEKKIRDAFHVSDQELKAADGTLVDLIVERMALLATQL
jgi:KEOPS complex subunit Cgi121